MTLEAGKEMDKRCVLNWLHEVYTAPNPEFNRRTDDELKMLAHDAIVLLIGQEAKQIVRKQCKKEYENGTIEYFAEWYCPHCDSLILRGFDNPSIKFCYKCGKPILWEGR